MNFRSHSAVVQGSNRIIPSIRRCGIRPDFAKAYMCFSEHSSNSARAAADQAPRFRSIIETKSGGRLFRLPWPSFCSAPIGRSRFPSGFGVDAASSPSNERWRRCGLPGLASECWFNVVCSVPGNLLIVFSRCQSRGVNFRLGPTGIDRLQ